MKVIPISQESQHFQKNPLFVASFRPETNVEIRFGRLFSKLIAYVSFIVSEKVDSK